MTWHQFLFVAALTFGPALIAAIVCALTKADELDSDLRWLVPERGEDA